MFIDIIQTVLLIFIAWFIVNTKGEGFKDLFSRKRRLVLDSCSLIDGRIVEIITSGFVAGELIIPQFILNELQMLADGNDSHKRERARFGLDIAHQLQDASKVPVVIDRTLFPDITATDDKLIALSKKVHGQLYTTDYNLAKVAAIEGVEVLNVNELAQTLRPIALPGEALTIKIVQKGSNQGQGVGYLDDGTMIVVENGFKHLGRYVPVTVTRMHQTVAGKMVFGQVQPSRERDERAAVPVSARTQASVETNATPAELKLQAALNASAPADMVDTTMTAAPRNTRTRGSRGRMQRTSASTISTAPASTDKLQGRLASKLRRNR
jgi:uncharacterized protein YacL